MHPSLVFALWLSVLLPLQACPPLALPVLLGLGLVLAGAPARRAFAGLARRSRWVLATLAITFVALTPGQYPVPGLPLTEEGLRSATEHLLRLLVVLLAVAWLVGGRSNEWLLAALAGFARPSTETGRRFVVRLGLTLRYAAAGEPRPSWRALVGAAAGERPDGAEAEVAHLVLDALPWSATEKGVAALALICGLAAFGSLR